MNSSSDHLWVLVWMAGLPTAKIPQTIAESAVSRRKRQARRKQSFCPKVATNSALLWTRNKPPAGEQAKANVYFISITRDNRTHTHTHTHRLLWFRLYAYNCVCVIVLKLFNTLDHNLVCAVNFLKLKILVIAGVIEQLVWRVCEVTSNWNRPTQIYIYV